MKEYSEVVKECLDRLVLARTRLVMTTPFFAILASKLAPVANNTWCKTLAVDGKHLFYNPYYVMGFENYAPELVDEYKEGLRVTFPDITDEQIDENIKGLSDNNLIFAICHEILHCAYDHFMRKGMRDPQKFNIAADYAINQILVREKIGEIKKSWLYDRIYDFKTAEEIYALLDNNDSGGDGDTQDQHGGDPAAGEDEVRNKRMADFQSSIMNAARAGGTPAEIARMVAEIMSPTIDWRSKLQRTLRSYMKSDLTYMNPSRRSWGFGGSYLGNPIFPGYKPDEDIDICVALDASGSISETMLRDFLSEVVGITRQFKQFKIRILTFDTAVYQVHDYKTGEEHKIFEYPIHGGGGTLFEAVWEHMKADKYKPKQLVMFTDGMPCYTWGDPDYCNTLFVVHSNPGIEAPFGATVHYAETK